MKRPLLLAVLMLACFAATPSFGANTVIHTPDTGGAGVDVAVPQAMLDVNGGIKLANDADACAAAKSGTMRWSGTALQYCNGTDWLTFAGTGSDYWTLSSTDLYYTGGNVGIGTDAPRGRLEVYGGSPWMASNWAKSIYLINGSMIRWAQSADSLYAGFGHTSNGWYWATNTTDDTAGTGTYPMSLSNAGKLTVLNGLTVSNGHVTVPTPTDDTDAATKAYVDALVGGASPDAFAFTNQSGVDLNTTITSNNVQLTGLTGVTAGVCSGCTMIVRNSINVGTSSNFTSNDVVAIKLTSSSLVGGTATASLTVGQTTSSIWTVTSNTDPCSALSLAVGTTCSDGTKYAGITPDGNVRMYTTPSDAGSYVWGSYPTSASAYDATTGETNTANIASADAAAAAAKYCYNLTANGKSDWYLPARDELSVLYTNRVAIGGFTTNYYWSSSMANTYQSYYRYFNDGSTGYYPNSGSYRVRCVRK